MDTKHQDGGGREGMKRRRRTTTRRTRESKALPPHAAALAATPERYVENMSPQSRPLAIVLGKISSIRRGKLKKK